MSLSPHVYIHLTDEPRMDDPQLIHFYRQYMQQVQNPIYPPAQLLVTQDVQAQIYKHFFDGPLKGPPAYQRRILKRLIDLIERAIPEDNANEDEVCNELMEHIAYLSTLPQEDFITSASQTQILSYTPPVPFEATPSRILIEEAPNLLAAGSNVGLRTWEAALHLAAYLHSNSGLVRGRTIIELGAGTGLVSILAAGVLDPKFVISTDGLPHVVDSIEKNIHRNRSALNLAGRIEAKMLDWSESSVENLTDVLENDVLEADGGMSAYDLIIGADITYNPEVVPVLAEVLSVLIHEMYAQNDMVAIISATVRNEKTLSVFREACMERQLRVEEVEFTCPSMRDQKGLFHEQAFPIIIMKITRQ